MVLAALAGVVAVYATCSAILLRCPYLLHGTKRRRFVCQHISHRGGAGERTENTISAFDHAVTDCHTDMLELDCQLTADGHVVVSHDNDLTRCGHPGVLISHTKYADLPLLAAKIPVDFAPGVCLDTVASGDRRIPLLSEVFDRFPSTAINLDVKNGGRALIEAVSRLVTHHQRQKLTVWGSFDHRIARLCSSLNPDVGLFCSGRSVLWIVCAAYVGLLPFLPIREDFFEIPMPLALVNMRERAAESEACQAQSMKRISSSDDLSDAQMESTSDFIGKSTRFPWLFRLMDSLLMRPFLFSHLKRRGIQVYVWVLNCEEEYERAFRLGASAVMTDYPSDLRTFLARHRV